MKILTKKQYSDLTDEIEDLTSRCADLRNQNTKLTGILNTCIEFCRHWKSNKWGNARAISTIATLLGVNKND